MLALEIKQSGGKLLPHSVLRGGSVSRESIAQKAKRDENRDLGMLEVFIGQGPLRQQQGN